MVLTLKKDQLRNRYLERNIRIVELYPWQFEVQVFEKKSWKRFTLATNLQAAELVKKYITREP